MKYNKYPTFALALMWAASLWLFPILFWQGRQARRTAIRMPVADPPDYGRFGAGEPEISIVGLGDSVIAGVGVRRLSDSVTARVADGMAKQYAKAIKWCARGISGATLSNILACLREKPLPGADVYIVSVGVNDVIGLTSAVRWHLQLLDLISRLDQKATIVLLGIPPIQYFTALPKPLRQILGIRAAILDKALRKVSTTLDRVIWLDISVNFECHYLADDGYHPNKQACVEIAGKIVDALVIKNESGGI